MLPVCIPSYKNREITKKLFSQLSTFDDVYLFVYDFDYKESGYDKLELPSNVKVIQINIDRDFKKYNVKRTDLSTKRCFIFDYMTSLGIDTYISIDDDCGDQHYIIDKNNSNNRVNLKTFIDKMYEKIEELNSKNKEWCIISPVVHFQKGTTLKSQIYKNQDFIYDYAWEGSVMFINRKVLSENKVKHVPLTQSDNAVNIACLRKQLLPMCFSNFHSLAFSMADNFTTLKEKFRKEIMYSFKEFPNDMSLSASWLNKNYIYTTNKNYLAILNGTTKMESKYEKLYEYACNEDIDNFVKCAKELLNIADIDNNDW